MGKGQCPVQNTSVTAALREEQLEASEQLANRSQAIHVVTDQQGWKGDGRPVLSRGRHQGDLAMLMCFDS